MLWERLFYLLFMLPALGAVWVYLYLNQPRHALVMGERY